MKTIELKRKVRWMDADPAGWIYYPRIFDYAGECEAELLQSIGIIRKEFRKKYQFPRVHAECHIKKTMALDAAFTIRFGPEKLGRTSIRYKFEIFLDENPSEIAAYGSVTVVVIQDGKPSPIPAQLRAAFTE
jgi:YbgC/YbaW family acyl-CoA thioester hydrolase